MKQTIVNTHCTYVG